MRLFKEKEETQSISEYVGEHRAVEIEGSVDVW